jgi:tetratricopeptide (TPR) repeat protein
VIPTVAAVVFWCSVAGADRDAWMNPPEAAPEGSAEAKVTEGFKRADQKDWRGAEAAFLEAIRLRPAMPEAWNGLGYALRHQQRYDESVKSYQEALTLKPDYPQALEYLGEAYLQMGKVDEAKEVLQQLRAVAPSEAEELAKAIDENGK